MPDPLDLAYLAGVIDSDGCITITRAERKFTRPSGHSWSSTYYATVLNIVGTNNVPHDLARSVFGGHVWTHNSPSRAHHRPVHTWAVEGPAAGKALAVLLPYLRMKPKQALLAIELSDLVTAQWAEIKATTKPPYRIPAEMLAMRESLWQRMGDLNEPTNRRRYSRG